jgi:hypothetical protein
MNTTQAKAVAHQVEAGRKVSRKRIALAYDKLAQSDPYDSSIDSEWRILSDAVLALGITEAEVPLS